MYNVAVKAYVYSWKIESLCLHIFNVKYILVYKLAVHVQYSTISLVPLRKEKKNQIDELLENNKYWQQKHAMKN